MSGILWLPDVEAHDFDAALAFLSLRFSEADAHKMVSRLRDAELTHRRSNDILRACDRLPLPVDDPGVKRTLKKVRKGKRLSPILLVSFPLGATVADGFHRVSSVYHRDPFADVPLRIAHYE